MNHGSPLFPTLHITVWNALNILLCTWFLRSLVANNLLHHKFTNNLLHHKFTNNLLHHKFSNNLLQITYYATDCPDSQHSHREVPGLALGAAGDQGPQGHQPAVAAAAAGGWRGQPLVPVLLRPVPQRLPEQGPQARRHLPLRRVPPGPHRLRQKVCSRAGGDNWTHLNNIINKKITL